MRQRVYYHWTLTEAVERKEGRNRLKESRKKEGREFYDDD